MYTKQGKVGIGVCSSLCLLSIMISIVSGSLFAGCGLFPRFEPGTGRLRVLITDTPFPIDLIKQATITVTRVEIRTAEEETDDASETLQASAVNNRPREDQDDENWIVIQEGERVFNLLELRNGRTNLLANADIPAGTYDQMRLVCTKGVVAVSSGQSAGEDRTFDLTVPSGEQTGIKLHFGFTVEDRKETTLLLDVDLSRAFRPIPGGQVENVAEIQGFHFTPSVGMRLINVVAAGSISGEVRDAGGQPLSGVTVSAVDSEGQPLAGTNTREDGTYKLIGLPAGSCTVTFEASGYVAVSQDNVQVTAGGTTVSINATLSPTPNP